MAFLSEILGHTITDIDGHYVGKLEDLIAREIKDATHPIVDADSHKQIFSRRNGVSHHASTLRCSDSLQARLLNP